MLGRGRIVDVDSLDAFDAHVAHGATSMRGWRIQDVDLRGREQMLARLDPAGAVLLGCDLSDAAESALVHAGAIVFQDVPDLPFNAYRSGLYTPDELLGGGDRSYPSTVDARIYAWSRSAERDVARTLAAAMHDHAIDDALGDWVLGRRVVGVMGGHALERGTPGYAAAARLGTLLARAGLTVATGGGPGAMEAANLGASGAAADDAALTAALDAVAAAPRFAGAMESWIGAGLAARALLGDATDTLGVPTWHYGHEPPNVFQTASAKYFQNAVREDILLRVATAGTVVLPGAAGTVQEIFQDACEGYYADDADWAPIVLVGSEHWRERLPAWPLLSALMRDRPAAAGIALVDDVDEAARRIVDARR